MQYDKHKIITGTGDNRILIYDRHTARASELFRAGGFLSCVRYSKNVLMASSTDSYVNMFLFK